MFISCAHANHLSVTDLSRQSGPTCEDARMSEQAPAGWYPQGQGNECYWDGTKWTDQVRAAGTTSMPKQPGAFSKLGGAVRNAVVEKKEAKAEHTRQQAEYERAAGALVTSGVFGSSTIEIYENGYVRVAAWGEGAGMTGAKAIDKKTPFEKLRSIKFTQAEVPAPSPTSALENTVGPAVAKLMKGGKGIMKASAPGMAMAGIAQLSSNAARKTFLTIATDRHIHTLSNQSSNSVGLKISHKAHDEVGRTLEIAGNAALGVSAVNPHGFAAPAVALAPPPPPSQPAAAPSLSDRMRELADLHKEGILSDEEFAGAKAKLLGGL